MGVMENVECRNNEGLGLDLIWGNGEICQGLVQGNNRWKAMF